MFAVGGNGCNIGDELVKNLKMSHLKFFVKKHGIVHEFSSSRTPQQNEVVERKNRSLQEMARTMIHEKNLANFFCAEAVNTTCYVQKHNNFRGFLK